MALKLYKETTVDPTIAFRNFIDWLTGTTRGVLATSGPTGVTVIEADDTVIRETGSGGLATLGATNLWRTGVALPTNAWIVVDFPSTGVLPGFQVYWHNSKNGGTARWGYQLIPDRDWATGGGQGSSPTQPSTIVPTAIVNGANQTATNWGASYNVFAFCDEGVLILATDDGSTNCNMYYAGEVDDAAAADAKPFVIYCNVDSMLNTGTEWARLSPVDNVTRLGQQGTGNGTSWVIQNFFSAFDWSPTDAQYMDFGNRPKTPIAMAFAARGHQHFVGFCRYMQLINSSAGNRGTTDTLAFLFLGDFPSGGQDLGAFSFPWDSTTAYP